ncbi:MAG: BolA family iron metabolism protein IbaG [Enterobacteriaceae bacterium]
MNEEQIKALLMTTLNLQEVHVTGDGSHFQLIAVGELFNDMRRLKREQAVYAPLMEHIADNRIHALTIRAFTPQEWQRERKLLGL